MVQDVRKFLNNSKSYIKMTCTITVRVLLPKVSFVVNIFTSFELESMCRSVTKANNSDKIE